MDNRSPSDAGFDWHIERTSQLRDMSRFSGELDRALSLRTRTPSVRASAARLREQWERLKRRIDGRTARLNEQWDSRSDEVERLRLERERLLALVELDDHLAASDDLEAVLLETLRCVSRSLACDGVLIVLYDVAGQTWRSATPRYRGGRGRLWPAAADRELADSLAAGARTGRCINIDGRPVGTGPRERGRAGHWLAVPVAYEDEFYGAVVTGRPITESGFAHDDEDALAAITRRLARVLAARIGVSARPVTGAGPKPEGFDQLWGQSAAFKQALALAANYALSDAPILIEGESGTGHESLARAIHRRSARAARPFVIVEAADLPEQVVADSLFGVTSTGPEGTVIERPGDLEMAEGGTLFLDEVAALGPVLQVRLLRYLREGTFERNEDRTPRKADVRLILSTTRDLDREVGDGRMRQDLYYLITVARLWLPPLRERGSDVVELARRFAQRVARKAGKAIDGIDVAAAHLLAAASYPDNVRQLAQIVERAVLLSKGPLIVTADLPDPMPGTAGQRPTAGEVSHAAAASQSVHAAVTAGVSGHYAKLKAAKKRAITAVEQAFVESVVETVGPNSSRAARHCGIHRAQWQRLAQAGTDTAPKKDRDDIHESGDTSKTDT
jgi:DNA-binding NtrC family response regulator